MHKRKDRAEVIYIWNEKKDSKKRKKIPSKLVISKRLKKMKLAKLDINSFIMKNVKTESL
jgi:uncharacterized protein YbaA (DUF1428 family)